MTKDQEKFMAYFVKVFRQRDSNVIWSLVWMNSHMNYMPNEVRIAYHGLTTRQRNEVVLAICELGE